MNKKTACALKHRKRKHKISLSAAFTLIELLVVMSTIGMLSSILLTALSNARQSASIAKLEEELRSLQTAMDEYYADNGYYPGGNNTIVSGGYNYSILGTDNNSYNVYYPGQGPGVMLDQTTNPTAVQFLTSALVPKYISGLPVGMLQGSTFHYSEGTGLNTPNSGAGQEGLIFCGNSGNAAQNYLIYFDYNTNKGNASYLNKLTVETLGSGYSMTATPYYCAAN